jgi:hypothetical protein
LRLTERTDASIIGTSMRRTAADECVSGAHIALIRV